jgi:hypothetical protein
VFVHVGLWGDQFRVSDGGEAAQNALFHGRDSYAVETGLKAARDRFSLTIEQDELTAMAPSKDWLPNVVSAVANGASLAAAVAVEHSSRNRQNTLVDQIGVQLDQVVPERLLARNYEQRGRSGKLWKLDFFIAYEQPVLIRAVTPNHNSIAATYTAFSDLTDKSNRRLTVFSRRPDQDDSALLRQVAELVPLASIQTTLLPPKQRH